MKTAENHLRTLYPAHTASNYLRYWKRFASHLAELNRTIAQIDHPFILEYIYELQQRGGRPIYINKQLVAIERVLDGLGRQIDNPVQGFRVKREGENAVLEPIEEEQLIAVLQDFLSAAKHRLEDKVILSLVHDQGLRAREIRALQVDHFDLDQGLVWVPSVSKSKARELTLEARQIRLMEQHLAAVRLQAAPELIQSKHHSRHRTALFGRLLKRVQKVLPELQSLEHWRSSRIMHWLSREPLLVVQERLGHQFASSTERYQLQGVKSLQQALKKYHPFAKTDNE